MWPFGSSRLLRARRIRPLPNRWSVLRQRETLTGIVLFAGLWFGVCLMIFNGRKDTPYRIGEILSNDIRARVPFSFESLTLTEAKRQEAQDNTPSVYLLNNALFKSISDDLVEGFRISRAAGSFADYQKQTQNRSFALQDEHAWKNLHEADEKTKLAYEEQIPKLLAWLRSLRFLNDAPPDRINKSGKVTLLDENNTKQDLEATRVRFVSSEEAEPDRLAREIEYHPQGLSKFPLEARPLVRAILTNRLVSNGKVVPLYLYDAELTKTEQEVRSDEKHVPVQRVSYEVGRPIAAGVIDENEMALLQRENEAFWNTVYTDPAATAKDRMQQLATYSLVGFLVAGLALYTRAYQPKIFNHAGRCAGVVAMGLLTILLGKLIVQLSPDHLPESTVLIVSITAGVLTIVYQQRYAFGTSCILIMMLLLTIAGDYRLFTVLASAAAVTCFSLGDIRHRQKLIETGLLTGAVAMLVTLVARLSSPELLYTAMPTTAIWHLILKTSAWAGVAGLLSGFVTLGFLPLIENTFGISTSMTLLEWKDPSRPLLRRLAIEAPGTYNHSLVVGTLAENAANAIGANGLLANVGALYHDIGKINKPLYFIENQTGKFNLHDQLTPAMSLLIIVGHVKDGLELAQQYKVPRILHQFIAEHHGTTLVAYFYHAAAKQGDEDETLVSELNFRYPGPKPRTKESAVLLLCDGVEAAVRAIPEPTPSRIEALVHKIAMKRLEDGQFEDADLTLSELHQAEESLIKSLLSIYHGRIAYPSGEAESQAAQSNEVITPDTRQTA